MNTGLNLARLGVVGRIRWSKGGVHFIGRAILLALLVVEGAFAAPTAKSLRNEDLRARSTTQLNPPRTLISNDRFRIEGKLGVGTQYLDNETDEGANANFGAGFKMSFDFVKFLRLDSQFQFNFSNERWQSKWVDDTRFINGFSVKEAAVKFSPVWEFELGAGAINQKDYINAPLLISNRAFPGGYAQLRLGNEQNYLGFRGQKLIPTSQSLDSDRQEKEPMPYFESLALMAHLEPNQHLIFIPYYQRFKYTDLPSSVAFQGVTRGNTVPDATPTSARFAFDFSGFVAGVDLEIKPNDYLSLGVCYSQIQNEEAPEAFKSGERACVKTPIIIGQTKIIPSYGVYYNESDTSPAAYNSGEFGHNNRQGDFYRLEVEFTDWNFKVETFYTAANEINDNIHQSDQEYFYILLETLYVEF